MRIVYFGSSDFSKIVLEEFFTRDIFPKLVITNPDKPKGRGLKVTPTPVKSLARKYSLEVMTPKNLEDAEVIKKLKEIDSELFVLVGYGKIIPSPLLKAPKIMPIALHPSLLPLYRGAAPINWAIINGEKETGVTIFKVRDKLDSGHIILQRKIAIEHNDDALIISVKLAKLGAELLFQAFSGIERNSYNLIPQDENRASFAPKLQRKDGKITWNKDAYSIRNLVRGLRGWPEAYTSYHDKIIKILEVDIESTESKEEPSTIVKLDKNGIYVATARGILKIKKLKPQGKKEMDAHAFLCGHHLIVGEKFS